MSLETLIEYVKLDSDEKHRNLSARLDVLDSKLTQILEFKWKIIGGSVVLSMVLTVLFQLATFWLKT